MNAEIVRADQIKAGEQYAILTTGRAPLCSLHDVFPLWTRGAENEPGWIPGQLVAKILPEPVEVREYWRLSYEWLRATPDCRLEWAESVHSFRYKADAEERLGRAWKTHASGREIRKQRIEHVRETILSREEVKP